MKTAIVTAFVLFCFLAGTVTCFAGSRDADAKVPISIQFGTSISPHVQQRIKQLLAPFSNIVSELNPNTASFENVTGVLLSFGNGSATQQLIPAQELKSLGGDGFAIRSRSSPSLLTLATDGNPSPVGEGVANQNLGAHIGSYALLQCLGFAFLHPLAPLSPASLSPSLSTLLYPCLTNGTQVDVREKAYWVARGLHYHTEHPLELTEFLNGFDAADTKWEDMVPEWDRVCEWLVATRQNRIEWLLLWAKEWDEFAWSTTRSSRLRIISDLAHMWGIWVGADVGIAEEQQHAWPMVSKVSTLEDEIAQIHKHLDWLYGKAGYDFLSTESGFSEFTHPSCWRMLQWMNTVANYTVSTWQRKAYIKCHCSMGQTCNNYTDPVSGGALNFNFLPHYAVNTMGVYPHTVQVYNWTEPSPSYGNTNFTFMFKFLEVEARPQKREVIYHGETAYWVNYDIDLPLFLPVYADSRLSDLRAIADAEKKGGWKMQGQVNFDSGWEWGYWLFDVITALAAYNPHMEIATQRGALEMMLTAHVTQFFGNKDTANQLTAILLDCIDLQTDLLIYGKVNGKFPDNIVKRNGQAYIEGWDTWSELGALASPNLSTQPLRLGLEEVRNPFGTDPHYTTEIEPLLAEMDTKFNGIVARLLLLKPRISATAMPLFQEILESSQMTALRCTQVHALYNYASSYWTKDSAWRKQQLTLAETALKNAIGIVKSRESKYRVPIDRIAGWRPNPTSYGYTYLWTVKSLFYWWRDYAKAIDITWEAALSPCYLNIISPLNVAFGEGIWTNTTQIVYDVLEDIGLLDGIADCLEQPSVEPQYPRDLS